MLFLIMGSGGSERIENTYFCKIDSLILIVSQINTDQFNVINKIFTIKCGKVLSL